jgi:two-component system sensor histidine kinase HydH
MSEPDAIAPPPAGPVGRTLQPFAIAALMGSVYLVLCGIFVVVFGELAWRQGGIPERAQEVELVRDLMFVVVSAMLLFAFIFLLLRRIVAHEAQAHRQQQALIDADRHAMTALFAASMAHDMGNLLQLAKTGIYNLKIHPTLGEAGEQAVSDLSAVHTQLGALSHRLLTVVRERTPGQPEQMNLANVVAEGVQAARAHDRVRQCEVTVSLVDCVALVNPVTMQRCLLNLIINAADATKGRGKIEVRLSMSSGQAVLEVHDNGPGIPEDQRRRVFGAFYTTKAMGTGLGLLSVRACAEEHRGRVEVLKSPLGGACFRLTLPLVSPPPAPAA